MISRFFPASPNVQRVVYYRGHRPLRALFFIFLGYLLGWYACAHPTAERLVHLSPPTGLPQ